MSLTMAYKSLVVLNELIRNIIKNRLAPNCGKTLSLNVSKKWVRAKVPYKISIGLAWRAVREETGRTALREQNTARSEPLVGKVCARETHAR